MSGLALLPLMISSFLYVQSFYVITQYAKDEDAHWNNYTHQCETEWGNFSVGSVMHVYKFRGLTYFICKEGEVGFDTNRSYVYMYGVKIPATAERIKTKCGIIYYSPVSLLSNLGRRVVCLLVYKDMENSTTVCEIKENESCAMVGETEMSKECTVSRCSKQGQFVSVGKGCKIKGRCYKPNEILIYGWWWWRTDCICVRGGKRKC